MVKFKKLNFIYHRVQYYLNDLSSCLHNSELQNFADDNTITATCKDVTDPLRTLKKEAERIILESNWSNDISSFYYSDINLFSIDYA